MVDLDGAGDKALYLAVTGGQYLLICRDCRLQTGYKELQVREGRSPAFFAPVSGSEDKWLSVSPESHTYGHYLMDERKYLANLHHLKEVPIPAFPIFVAHVYLSHEESGQHGSCSLRYNVYLILLSYNLRYAVAPTYEAIFAVIKRLATGLEKKGAERDVGGTSGTYKVDKSDKQESKNESYPAGRKHFAEAPDQKFTSAGIPHKQFIVMCYTSFGLNICSHIILTDFQVW